MFDGLLKPKFYNKCKMGIKLTKIQLDAINKKRNAVEKYLKKDIADLLKNGLDYNAYGRAEGLLIEQNMSCCYHLIENFCLAISTNLSIMQKDSECPEECREAVPSLMFAAARFADLPKLRDLRSLFTEKYGTALENFVNKEFVGRLKAGPPTKDVKLQLMREIAAEFSIQWDSKALEQKLSTPPSSVQEHHSKYASPEEIEDDSHQNCRRETRDFVSERRSEGVGSKIWPEEKPTTNDDHSPFGRPKETSDNIKLKLSSTSRKDEKEEEQELGGTSRSGKPLCGNVPPPYIKTKPEKEENKVREGGSPQEAKPKPRSVRQRRLKLPPGHEAEQSSGSTKASDNSRNEVDEEEKVIDGLLMHYCKKQPAPSKPLPLRESNSIRNRRTESESSSSPARAASFPAKAMSPTEPDETARGHCRVNSLENGMFPPGHVHPNLPDCDDLASRIAALRGR